MLLPIDNPELLVGVLLVIIAAVGLAGGNVVIGGFTLNLSTAQGIAYAFILAVGSLGLVMILRELFFT